MTPKEKANKLRYQFESAMQDADMRGHYNQAAKGCALIAVDEIMEFMKMDDEYTETASNANSKWVDYWEEVKTEIEKL